MTCYTTLLRPDIERRHHPRPIEAGPVLSKAAGSIPKDKSRDARRPFVSWRRTTRSKRAND